MVKFKPFQAIRPQFDNMKEVATLPYDVIDDQQARELAKNPQSFVHIDRAEVDLPKDLNPYDPAVYEQAANTLRQWLAEGDRKSVV